MCIYIYIYIYRHHLEYERHEMCPLHLVVPQSLSSSSPLMAATLSSSSSPTGWRHAKPSSPVGVTRKPLVPYHSNITSFKWTHLVKTFFIATENIPAHGQVYTDAKIYSLASILFHGTLHSKALSHVWE